MKAFDVAIVGAGPAGSATAIFLLRQGYSVALIDKQQFPREKLCGDFVNPANWPILRDLGVAETILACRHQKIMHFGISSCSGDMAEVPLAKAENDCGLSIRRLDFDFALLQKAKNRGATLFQGCRISGLKRESKGWSLDADHSGTVDKLGAQVLIGADGRNSWIAHRLGMARTRAVQKSSIGFQLRLNSSISTNGNVEIHVFDGGYAGVVGLGDGTVTLGFAVEKTRFEEAVTLEYLLRSCLTLNPRLKAILQNSQCIGEARSTYPIYFSPRRSYDERVLLVGDAARVNEPVTGEGIYFALKSAELSASALHRAFKTSDFSAAQLRRYEQDCRSEFRTRRRINAFVRRLIYRPPLLSTFIRLSHKRTRLLESIVQRVCAPDRPSKIRVPSPFAGEG